MASKYSGGLTLAFLLSGILALGTAAQADNTPQLRVGPIYKAGPGEVAVMVESPSSLTRISASGIKLFLDGQEAATAYNKKNFLDSENELAWILCIDVSAGMGLPPLRETRDVLKSFLNNSRSLRVELLTFGAEIRTILKFQDAHNRVLLTQAIDSLTPGDRNSKTNLDQALSAALANYESIAHGIPERRRILVIWGGKDQTGPGVLDNVVNKANALGIPIDAVGLGEIKAQNRAVLKGLAGQTGGLFVSAAHGSNVRLKDALTLIYSQVMERLAIVAYFKFSLDALEGKDLSIELHQPHGPAIKGSMAVNRFPQQKRTEEISKGQEKGVPATPLQEIIEETDVPKKAATPQESVIPSRPPWVNWLIVVVLASIVFVAIVVIGRQKKPQEIPAIPESKKKTPLIEAGPVFRVPESATAPRVTEKMPEPPRRTSVGGDFPPPRPQRPAAILIGLGGAVQGQRFPLEKDIFHIGADPNNDLPIPGDEYVSGNHAYLRYEKGSLFISDLGSLNGTFVNGQRVSGTARVLMPGDRIKIGNSTFEVRNA